MITENNLANQLQLLLEVLSMVQQSATVGGLSGEQNKKAMDFFSRIDLSGGEAADRTIFANHFVKIISSLLKNPIIDETEFQPFDEYVDSNFNSTNIGLKPLPIIGHETINFIQRLIEQIFNNRTTEDPIPSQSKAPAVMQQNQTKTIIPSIESETIDVDIEPSPASRPLLSRIATSIPLKTARDLWTDLFMHSDEVVKVSQKTDIKDVPLSTFLRPKAEISILQTTIGEKRDHFQPSSDPIPQQTKERPVVLWNTISNQTPPPANAPKSVESLNFPIQTAPQYIEPNRVHPRGTDQAIITGSIDGRIIPTAMPFFGAPFNSSFLIHRRKKEKKKRSDDEESEERESTPWQGFDS